MDTKLVAKLQSLSISLHGGLDAIDQLQAEQQQRLQDILDLRKEAGLVGDEGSATIRLHRSLIADIEKLRALHQLAHASAKRDTERMGWPTGCPERAEDDQFDTVVDIKVAA